MDAKIMTLRQRFDAMLSGAFLRWGEPVFMESLIVYSQDRERARTTLNPDLFIHLVIFENQRQRLQDAQGASAPLGESFDAALEAAWARHEARETQDAICNSALDGPAIPAQVTVAAWRGRRGDHFLRIAVDGESQGYRIEGGVDVVTD